MWGAGVNVMKYKFVCVVDLTGSSSFGLACLLMEQYWVQFLTVAEIFI